VAALHYARRCSLAFPNDLVLDNAAGTDVTFRLRSRDGNGSQYIDIASNLATPHLIAVRHNVQGPKDAPVDRHLVQVAKSLVTATGKLVTVTVNLTVAVPRDPVVTPTVVRDEVFHVLDFMSDGTLATMPATANLDALLRGET